MKKGVIVFAILLSGLGWGLSSAMASPPAPYTGGASVVKVLHPADGSTVTITATGAVIKQSPGHTAYREGWVNPCDIGGINLASDLKGQLRAGTTNPYTSAQQSNTNAGCGSPAASPNSSSSSNANANASATANVTTAGNVQIQPSTSNNSGSSQSARQPAPATTSAPNSLPNTGAGPVVPAVGASTILGTVGHYLLTRRRLK